MNRIIGSFEKYKEVLGTNNEVIESTKEYDERKDIISGARQALAISKLEGYHPIETIEEINSLLLELKKCAEQISHLKEKYSEGVGVLQDINGNRIEEMKHMEKDEFEQELMKLQSLGKASKEITEVLKDASKVNIEMDSKDDITIDLESGIYRQMLTSVCARDRKSVV